MFLDPDVAYHLARARHELLFAARAASPTIATIHLELGIRHLAMGLVAHVRPAARPAVGD